MQFLDFFDGGSSDSLGPNWAEAEDGVVAFRIEGGGIMAIRGAHIPFGFATIQGRAFVVPGPWGNDQYAELVYNVSGAAKRTLCGVGVRGSGPGQLNYTGYGLLVRPDFAVLELRRYVNDQVRLGAVLANSVTFNLAAGDRFGLRVNGTRLRGYQNRIVIPGFDIIDATVASGTPGLLDAAADTTSDGSGYPVEWREFLATDAAETIFEKKSGGLRKFRMGLTYGTRIRTREPG